VRTAHLHEFLELLRVLAARAPAAFTAPLAAAVARAAPRAGERCLVLIARCGLARAPPLPLLGVLLAPACRARFARADTAGPYASLLGALAGGCAGFRRAHGAAAWAALSALLDARDAGVLDRAYDALARVAARVRGCAPRFDRVRAHLALPGGRLLPAIVALLLVADVSRADELSDAGALDALARDAAANPAAAFALMRLAANPNVALALAKGGAWMAAYAPARPHILQLFLVVFQHEEIRALVAAHDAFYALVAALAAQPPLHGLLARVVRRLALTRAVVERLCARGALGEFIGRAGAADALRVANVVAMVGFVPELVPVCEIVWRALGEEELMADGLVLAVQLAELDGPECRERMRALRVERRVAQIEGSAADKRIRRLAARFMDAIGNG
jgi:hypothetical protein